MHTTLENPVGTVRRVSHNGPRSGSGRPRQRTGGLRRRRPRPCPSDLGRVSDNGHGAGPTSSARTGALTVLTMLMMLTMLTMLTQRSQPSTESYDELGCGRVVDAGIPLITDLRRA